MGNESRFELPHGEMGCRAKTKAEMGSLKAADVGQKVAGKLATESRWRVIG
jgi:hypothetical protein